MAYQLLCTDIDGTLATSAKEVTPRTRAAIRAARDRGLYVTLATGRMPAALAQFADVMPGPAPLICGNGSVLADARTKEFLEDSPMPRETALALLARGREVGATLVVWLGDSLWIEGTPRAIAKYERGAHHASIPLAEYLRAPGDGAHKVLCLAPAETIAALQRSLKEKPVPGAAHFTSDENTLEAVRQGIDKGFGLRRCAERLGLDPGEVIAVGDAMNDVPMLRAAGLGAAMENAGPEVAAEADLIVPSNDGEGVAWLIEHYLLGG